MKMQWPQLGPRRSPEERIAADKRGWAQIRFTWCELAASHESTASATDGCPRETQIRFPTTGLHRTARADVPAPGHAGSLTERRLRIVARASHGSVGIFRCGDLYRCHMPSEDVRQLLCRP